MDFTRANYLRVEADVLEALREVGEKHGISFSSGNGRYGARFVFQINADLADTEAAEKRAKAEFSLLCRQAGLEPDDYGLTFIGNNVAYKIVGVKPSRPRYPIQVVRVHDGRPFKYSKLAEHQLQVARNRRDEESAKQFAAETADRFADMAQF